MIYDTLNVSIIIPTRNRSEHLHRTLGHLTNIEIPPSLDFEIIIVDNGSTDNTQQVIESFRKEMPQVRGIIQAQPGASRARNLGVQTAKGEIIVFLDDDVKPSRRWLVELVAGFEDPKVGFVGGEIVLDPERTPSWMTPFHHGLFASTEFQDPANRASRSANCAYRKQCFEGSLGFDPEIGAGTPYGFAEEFLFNWGLKEAGFQFAFNEKASVVHEYDVSRCSLESMRKMAIQTGMSGAYAVYHFGHAIPKFPWLRTILLTGIMNGIMKLKPRERQFLTEREFCSIQRAAHMKQYLVERKRPPNYDRLARKKLRGILS